MSLFFYYVPHSTSNATSAVLDELEYDLPSPLAKRIELSIQAGDTKAPHYLATVNPNGRVPAIVHDGAPIWESAAITMYLGETFGVAGSSDHGKRPLYPALGPKRGEVMKWIVWGNTTLADAGGRLSATLPVGTAGSTEQGSQDFVPEKDKSSAEEAQAKKDIARCLDILDGALHDKDFLLGQEYCLADTHLWSFLSWIGIMGVSLDTHPNVKGWMARVGDRPALKRE
jgi:glutathione S-transferase